MFPNFATESYSAPPPRPITPFPPNSLLCCSSFSPPVLFFARGSHFLRFRLSLSPCACWTSAGSSHTFRRRGPLTDVHFLCPTSMKRSYGSVASNVLQGFPCLLWPPHNPTTTRFALTVCTMYLAGGPRVSGGSPLMWFKHLKENILSDYRQAAERQDIGFAGRFCFVFLFFIGCKN